MKFRKPRTARTAVGLSVVALVATLGAGCSRAEPDVAAYVGDTAINQQQVDDAVSGISTALEGQQISPQAVTNAMIYGALSEQIAAEQDITITDGERDTLVKSSDFAALLDVPDAKPVAYDLADQQIVAQKVGAETFLAAVKDTSVTVNPRLGVLDPEQKLIVGGKSGSLSQPSVASPTPVP